MKYIKYFLASFIKKNSIPPHPRVGHTKCDRSTGSLGRGHMGFWAADARIGPARGRALALTRDQASLRSFPLFNS